MNAKEFLRAKFNCTDDEIHKQLYDLVSDHREWPLVLKLFEDYKNYTANCLKPELPSNFKEAIETAWDKTTKIHPNNY